MKSTHIYNLSFLKHNLFKKK